MHGILQLLPIGESDVSRPSISKMSFPFTSWFPLLKNGSENQLLVLAVSHHIHSF
jgi:hypothetical protein